MTFSALRSSSALKQQDFNRHFLGMLAGDTPDRQATVAAALGAETGPSGETANDNQPNRAARRRWKALQDGEEALDFGQLSEVLKALQEKGFSIDPSALGTGTPLSSQSFYDALRENAESATLLQAELQSLRDRTKQERGFLKTLFNVFASPSPVEQALQNVASFEAYCRENNVTFDDVARGLESPHSTSFSADAWNKVKDFRFLVAAIGGGLIGAATGAIGGVSLMDAVPLASSVPGVFFGVLPYIAVPFISLSIFRAFSEKSILSEWKTFARFGATMAVGTAIGLGVTSLMSGFLPSLSVTAAAEVASQTASGAAAFSPTQYILHAIGLFAGLAGIHKMAKDHLNPPVETNPEKKGFLTAAFARASGLIVNDYTAPWIERGGKVLTAMGDFTDKTFAQFMNWVGIPAIFLMVGDTVAKGGLEQFATYGSYYGTVALGMLGCAATLVTVAYLYGCRAKEFKEIARTASTAFSISSSAATMPVTKECLANMGVSEKVRNSVVPLGANFNMMGTALYLGVTAACGATMFGHDLSILERLSIIGTAIVTAFAAPGTPSSSLLFLDPVLARIGLSPAQAQEIYKMIIPADRFFDMGQTALNVTGDMIVALDTERAEKKAAQTKEGGENPSGEKNPPPAAPAAPAP